jgi:hypothetical protein
MSPIGLTPMQPDGMSRVVCNQCAPNRHVERITTDCIGTVQRPCPWHSQANSVYGYRPDGWEGQVGEWLRCPGCIRVAEAREYTMLRSGHAIQGR